MATIKVKLRPSSVVGRAGTIFYQVTHRRATQQITTNIRLQPDEWDAIGEQVVVSVADKSIIQNRIDSDIALLKRIVKDLDIQVARMSCVCIGLYAEPDRIDA